MIISNFFITYIAECTIHFGQVMPFKGMIVLDMLCNGKTINKLIVSTNSIKLLYTMQELRLGKKPTPF